MGSLREMEVPDWAFQPPAHAITPQVAPKRQPIIVDMDAAADGICKQPRGQLQDAYDQLVVYIWNVTSCGCDRKLPNSPRTEIDMPAPFDGIESEFDDMVVPDLPPALPLPHPT